MKVGVLFLGIMLMGTPLRVI